MCVKGIEGIEVDFEIHIHHLGNTVDPHLNASRK